MRDLLRLLPFFAVVFAVLATVQHDPFFWDTVQLASKHAHFFYQNDLRWAALPAEIDSGHPPVFGWFIALGWSLFGKTLPVSHWLMAPFLLANVWLLWRLGRRFGGAEWAWWLLPLVLLDPVVAGQSVLVSPDLALLCWFLLAVEGLFGRQRWFVVLGILGLCMTSMRGMMTAGALFVWTLVNWKLEIGNWKLFAPRTNLDQQFPISNFQLFLPGFAFAAWFLWWHWQATGWVGFHAGSPWAGAFERSGWTDFWKNVLVVGWRWVDFGRCFEWAATFFILVFIRAKPSPTLLVLLCCTAFFLTPSALLHHNLSAHRYFLPAFLAFHLLVFQGIVQAGFSATKKKLLLAALSIGLATGNLWVYPHGISMDWDATLAHQPYHRLRAEMMVFLENEKIDPTRVGSAFPNLSSGENLRLDGDPRRFAELDFDRNDYVLISNVFNDFSKADHERLQRDWQRIKRLENAGVWLELYTRRH